MGVAWDVAHRFFDGVGWYHKLAGWVCYLLHGMGVRVRLGLVEIVHLVWIGMGICFLQGLGSGLERCRWGSTHILCIWRSSRSIGIG